MNKIRKTELLSPAGSIDALKQAIHNGADAVYLGGSHFGARAYAANFSNSELIEAIEYSHLYGVKVYITVNTLIFENEIESFKKYIQFLISAGADALIMQDVGLAHWVISSSNIPVHSSTQMHNYSAGNAEFIKAQGFSRLIAARETEIDTIQHMSEIIDTEVFINGALCISYSGQCLFSAFEHSRSGNRGMCAQACRMKYSLYADGGKIIDNKYLLSPKDLATLENITEIIKAGACSLKIEGRMKSPEYVGYITKLYREIIDSHYIEEKHRVTIEQKNNLERLFNRGFTKGYAFGLDNKELMSTDRPNHAGVYIGDVISFDNIYITIKLTSPLHQGDGIKFDKADKGMICNKIYINGKLTSSGESGQVIQLDNNINLKSTDRVMLTKDTNLIKSLSSYDEKKLPVVIDGSFILGEPSRIKISDHDGNIAVCTGDIIEQSINAPLSESDIEASLLRLGDTAYYAEKVNFEMSDNIFISKSNLNKLRRDAVEILNGKRIATNKYTFESTEDNLRAPLPLPFKISCTARTKAQLMKLLEYPDIRIFTTEFDLYTEYKSIADIYYMLPPLSDNKAEYTGEKLVIRDTGGIKYANNNIVISDYLMNLSNSLSLAHLHSLGIKNSCLSVELTNENIKSTAENYKDKYGEYPNAEVLIYGRVQLMAMKHCIIEGNFECGRCKTSEFYIEDIKGNKFPVVAGENCGNIIYSKEQLDNTEDIDYYESCGINSVRIDFFDESPDEVALIMKKVYKN
ncbi:MAG: U32 family peptidase [Clostridia bacterium]|nr:U32 family peptidase [Clostridia bacterium]